MLKSKVLMRTLLCSVEAFFSWATWFTCLRRIFLKKRNTREPATLEPSWMVQAFWMTFQRSWAAIEWGNEKSRSGTSLLLMRFVYVDAWCMLTSWLCWLILNSVSGATCSTTQYSPELFVQHLREESHSLLCPPMPCARGQKKQFDICVDFPGTVTGTCLKLWDQTRRNKSTANNKTKQIYCSWLKTAFSPLHLRSSAGLYGCSSHKITWQFTLETVF